MNDPDVSMMSVSVYLYYELHGQIPEDHAAHITEIPGITDATERDVQQSVIVDSVAAAISKDTC